jgi:hypothetical protein
MQAGVNIITKNISEPLTLVTSHLEVMHHAWLAHAAIATGTSGSRTKSPQVSGLTMRCGDSVSTLTDMDGVGSCTKRYIRCSSWYSSLPSPARRNVHRAVLLLSFAVCVVGL